MTSQRPNQWLPPQNQNTPWNQTPRQNPQWAPPQQNWSPYNSPTGQQVPQQGQQWPSYPAPVQAPVGKVQKKSISAFLIIGFCLFILPVLVRVFLAFISVDVNPNPVPVPPVTHSPTAQPTQPKPAPPQPTNPTSGYYNEDYVVPEASSNPPDLPLPTTYGEAMEWMTSNSFYSQELSVPVRCDIDAIPLVSASKAELEAHFNEQTECLVRVFGPAMERAGFELVRPQVVVYSSTVQSPCGVMPESNAAYCSADQRMYYSVTLPRILPPDLATSDFVVESVMAHEFAHSLQGRTGILISELAWQERVSESDALELSRRTEVQADCWAGMFNQAVAQSISLTAADNENVRNVFYNIGDDVLSQDPDYIGNHGHGASRTYWYDQGFTNRSIGACNTFTADSSLVR